METQYINLNMTPIGVTPTFHISQYDVGRVLGLIVHSGGATVDLDAYTCSIEATRSDGTAITSAVATTDNVGIFEVTPTMSNKADKYRCQLVIVDANSKRVASLPFDMEVTKAAMDENSESIEEDASLYQQYTEAVQANLANEATARQTADNTLQGNINSEAATRASADSNLQSQINQIVAPSGEAPSAAEVQNARIGADGVTYDTLGNAIRGQVTDLKSALKAEGMYYVGEPNKQQVLFTINDCAVGDTIAYSLTSQLSTVGYIELLNANNQRLGIVGKTSGASTQIDYSGTFTIPSNFDHAIADKGTGTHLEIHYLYNVNGLIGVAKETANALNSPFEKYDDALRWITDICILNQTYLYYRMQYIWHNAHGYDYLFRLQGSNDKTTWTDFADMARRTAPETIPDIEYIANSNAIVVVDWRFAPSSCDKENYSIKPSKVLKRSFLPKYMESEFDADHSVFIPYDKRMNFIKGVDVKDRDYSQYRLSTVMIRNSGYDYYFRLEGSNDGSSWTTLENLFRTTALASYPKYEVASGNKFDLLINWDEAPASLSLLNFIIKDTNTVSVSTAIAEYALGQQDMNGVYAVKDNISHIIVVDKYGSGDYATIKGACEAITGSALNNQYEIVVKAGFYNENDIAVPPYTHIHGVIPETVIVSSEGYAGTQPVFDQKDGSSKLSNLHIISHTGYCIHYDNNLNERVIVNENLILEKATTGNIIGGGSFLYGTVYKWLNCVFINGYVACHTNTTSYGNTHLLFEGCKFINASASLGSVGEFGLCVAEFNNCECPKFGRVVSSFYQRYRTSEDLSTYFANTFEWTVNGHNNKNFVFAVNSYGEGLVYETANANEQISISGSAVDALFGLVKTRKGNVQFKGKAYGTYRVMDAKTGSSQDLDRFQMWKRLGDCTTTNKTLSVTVGNQTQTYTFDKDYSTLQTSEVDILADVNSTITIAVLKKYTPNCYGNCYTEEKTFFYPTGNGVQEGQYIKADGTICESNCPANEVYGRVLEDGASGELTQVWIGKSCRLTLDDGRYGIGSDGKLSSSASTKIGTASAGVFVIDD
jgi:hypothetical protein